MRNVVSAPVTATHDAFAETLQSVHENAFLLYTENKILNMGVRN